VSIAPEGIRQRAWRRLDGVRDLPPGIFALVMATGICSTALRDDGHAAMSAVLLAGAIVSFAGLLVALGLRLVLFPGRVAEDLQTPDRSFAFFTVVAAGNVLSVRLAADNHEAVATALAGLGAMVWLVLTYGIPVALIFASRRRPVLAGANGTWFVLVVGTQSVALSLAAADRPGGGHAPAIALLAVLLWSTGVVLYLIIAALVLTRLLLFPIRTAELDSPYWVIMGASAITVLTAAQILNLPPAPAVTTVRPVAAGLGLMLWAFGTWLIPFLVVFWIRRHVRDRTRPAYRPALWSVVFPLGMYAVASIRFGAAAGLSMIVGVGRAWTWVAIPAWVVVFSGMCRTTARSLVCSTVSARRGGR
jgi:tellurite resistance protein TehA-like permease